MRSAGYDWLFHRPAVRSTAAAPSLLLLLPGFLLAPFWWVGVDGGGQAGRQARRAMLRAHTATACLPGAALRLSLSLFSLCLSPLPSFLCVPGERRQASRSVASSKHAAAEERSSHDAGNSGREQQPPLEVGTPPRRAMQMRLLWGGVFVLKRGICCFLVLLCFGALAPPRPLSQSN